jgi:hypothetical protein
MNNNTLYIQPHHILLMKETKTPKKKTKEQKMKEVFLIKKSMHV